MKIFKRKHFQALIYSIFLSLPLLSVLGRCVYTIANKNAYQSYYGETINESENHYINSNTFELSNRYVFNCTNYDPNTITGIGVGGNNLRIVFDNVDIITNTTGVDLSNMTQLSFWKGSSDNFIYLYAFDSQGNNLLSGYSSASYLLTFEFTYISNNLDSRMLEYTNCFYYLTYNNYSYLDNAFEYSLDRFVTENDYGELDFFTWFSSLFLSGNTLDSLYIHFINWYMNYILYVSLGYLIFSVLLWFVNFFRRLVDDTQNINVGGM